MMKGRRRRAFFLGPLVALLVPALASAHPLGNFTINHYTGLRVERDRILVDQVLDLAEIPAFQEIQVIDPGAASAPAPGLAAGYALQRCSELATDLELSVGGSRRDLRLTASGVSFPPGAGGLLTLRLVCTYEAGLAGPLAAGTTITFDDRSYAQRIGWREIVVAGDGTTVSGDDLLEAGVSGRLTSYPSDLLAQPLDLPRVAFTAAPGGTALPPFVVPEAVTPVGVAPDQALVTGPAGPAVVPGGVTELPAELTTLLHTADLSAPLIALSLLIAAGLGVLHAITPGHGKTIMAAYLVGTRGNVAQAIGLGTTVAVSHTLGVLALGVLTVAASSVFPSERLFPILGAISGFLVVGIGAWLLLSLAGQVRRRRAVERLHAAAHTAAHANAQGHDHPSPRPHEHEHEHAHEHEHEDLHAGEPGGWHDHGGVRHTHLPAPSLEGTLHWRGIFTLGLAGGLVPSASAILLLLGAVSVGRPALGLVLIVAFGVGMALVLAGIGLVLVYARGLLERLPSIARDGRFATATSLLAACVVLGFGLVITSGALATLRF